MLAAAIILAALPRVAIVIPGYEFNPATGLLWPVVAYASGPAGRTRKGTG